MIIRDARPDDLEALLALLEENRIREVSEDYSDPSPYASALAEILDSDHATVLIGEVDGKPVATAQVTWLRRLMYAGGLVCQIESVRVTSARRGQGLGRTLMEWVLADARRRGCARAELTSNVRRADARRFYESLGFAPSHVGMKLYLAPGVLAADDHSAPLDPA